MSAVSMGSGITAIAEADAPARESTATPPVAPEPIEVAPPVEPEPAPIAPTEPPVQTSNVDVAELMSMMRQEFAAAVDDVERRLSQARELENSALHGTDRKVHAEDLNISRFLLDGYLVTANSPTVGSIAWSSLHVVYMGIDYTIANGNTDKKYAWFVKPPTGTTATLLTGDVLPALGSNDALIFVNNSGTPVSALETSISYAVGPGVIGNSQLAQDVQNVISTLQANDIALQSALDGSITTYYSNEPPWPENAPSPGGGNINMGDVWYDANDNGAYRWTGATPGAGVTANKWIKIADTDNSALEGKVNTKTTTYLANLSPGPTAPAGGFTTGDLWMVIDKQNLMKRWSGSAWVDLQLGDAAISGVGGAKIGSGINASNVTTGTLVGSLVGTGVSASNVTTGTLAGSLVGTGVSGTNITTGTVAGARVGAGVTNVSLTGVTGTLGNANLAVNAVQPKNINAAFHLLY